MMLVTNEYGGIAGLVTLKQIIGVIVGTVMEDDPPSAEADSGILPLWDGAYLMGGGLTIIEINDRLKGAGITAPEGEYQTIAGLALHELGELPREGEPVLVGDRHGGRARQPGAVGARGCRPTGVAQSGSSWRAMAKRTSTLPAVCRIEHRYGSGLVFGRLVLGLRVGICFR